MADLPPLEFPDCPFRVRKDLIPVDMLPLMKLCLRQADKAEYYCNIDEVLPRKKSKKKEVNK